MVHPYCGILGNCRKIWRDFYQLIMKTSQDPLFSEGSRVQKTVGKMRKSHRVPYLVNMLEITQEENWRNYNIVSEEEDQGAKRQDSHRLLFYIFWILKCWKYIDFYLKHWTWSRTWVPNTNPLVVWCEAGHFTLREPWFFHMQNNGENNTSIISRCEHSLRLCLK